MFTYLYISVSSYVSILPTSRRSSLAGPTARSPTGTRSTCSRCDIDQTYLSISSSSYVTVCGWDMYVCVYVSFYIYDFLYYIIMQLKILTSRQIYIYIFRERGRYTYMNINININKYIHTYIYMYIRMYIYIYIYMCVCACVRVCVCMYTSMYMSIYIYLPFQWATSSFCTQPPPPPLASQIRVVDGSDEAEMTGLHLSDDGSFFASASADRWS